MECATVLLAVALDFAFAGIKPKWRQWRSRFFAEKREACTIAFKACMRQNLRRNGNRDAAGDEGGLLVQRGKAGNGKAEGEGDAKPQRQREKSAGGLACWRYSGAGRRSSLPESVLVSPCHERREEMLDVLLGLVLGFLLAFQEASVFLAEMSIASGSS